MKRRDFITGTAGAATLLAGCSGDANTETENPSTERQAGGAESYTVTMAPVGEVSFDSVPRSVANYFPGYADMAVALGHGDAINSVGIKSRYFTDYYDELDGVDIDKESLTQLYQGGLDKEVFYNLASDLHLVDPPWFIYNFQAFDREDIEELSENVAPFIGNTIFRRTDSWHDYRYYTMYGAFEKVAQIFREAERFSRFQEFHDSFIADVQAKLPPARDRPNALLAYAASDEPEAFSPYRLSGKGTNKKQFHDLGITDALAGTGIDGLSTSDRGKIDYETMLEVDPDSILLRGHETKTREEFEDTVLAYMRNDDVASELTAVKEGNVYRGGPIYEGPIQNLFLTERFAKRYFPETYSGELFDREEVASIVTS